MKKLIFLVSVFFTLAASAFDHSHAEWDRWLKKYTKVSGPVTEVDYARAKQDGDVFNSYRETLSAVSQTQYDNFTDSEKMAFLINAYNAFTVHLILNNYPLKSIKDLGGIFSSPWKKKFFKLLGEDRHLDFVEHDLLREKWAEPRIHFAVVCASKGCPALKGEAFTGPKLEKQLESGAKLFLSDSGRNRFEAKENKLYLSKIFDWYGKDFVKKAGSVQSFVATRMGATPAEVEAISKASLGFLDYDWSLNEPSKEKETPRSAKP